MILRLLRLFSAFRALEEDRDATVAQLRAELSDAQDEARDLTAKLDDRTELWRLVHESAAAEREAHRMVINYSVQQRFGITPYPDAQHLPESVGPETGAHVPRRQLPSELMDAAKKQFMPELIAKYNARK